MTVVKWLCNMEYIPIFSKEERFLNVWDFSMVHENSKFEIKYYPG